MKNYILAIVLISICHLGLAQQKVFDIHVHIWNGKQSVEEYISQVDSTNQHVTKFGGIYMAERGKLVLTREKNDELVALSKQYPKVVPICSVHPMDGDSAIQELKRLGNVGVSIIKLHPHTQKFDMKDVQVLKLCQQAGDLGIVVLMDNASIIPGDCENLFDLAVKCPKTKFIFAHMGALNFRFWNILTLARTAKGFFMDNIYFDISATITLVANSPLEKEFIWTIRNAGIDRILLGSDFPQFTLKQTIEALDRLDLAPGEKNKIRYENASNLLSHKENR